MKTYMKAIAIAILWLSGWSYLMSWEGKFDPGANGPVGRKEFLDSVAEKGAVAGDTIYIGADTILINKWINDTAKVLRPEMQDSAARAAYDTAGVLRTFTQEVIEDSLVEVRAEVPELVEDSLVEVRAEVPELVEDSLVEIRSEIAANTSPAEVAAIVNDSLQQDPIMFAGDVKMEADLNVEGQFTSTLSLGLEYYFGRSVVQLMATVGDDADDYVDWADNKWDDAAAGVHSDNTTDYLTDHQSITLTDGADNDGMHLDFTDTDLTLFADGDTSVMADYINWSINILTQDIADLNDTDGLGLIFACDAQGTLTNYFYYLMDDDDLSNGWNHLKVAKSAFTGVGKAEGDSMWHTITGVSLYFDGAPDAEVIVSIDNIQMVRDDPDAAEPNPFQSEGPDGTWTADWTQEGSGNVWVVEESNELRMIGVYPDQITTSKSYGDFNVSGISYPNSQDACYLLNYDAASSLRNASLTAGDLTILDSVGTTHHKSFAVTSGDKVYWGAIRKGTSITARVSLDGVNWTSISTLCKAGIKQLALLAAGAASPYAKCSSMALSSVEYAAEAGAAQRLKNGLSFDLSGNLTTHGTWDGITARLDVDENTVGFSGALHMDADGNLIDCDADGTTTLPCFGLAIEAGVGSGKLILLQGKIVNTAWNWTIGSVLYISPTVGGLSATVASGDYYNQVGIAIGADAIYFDPQAFDVIVKP